MQLRLKKEWFNPLYFHLRKYVDDPAIRKIMVYGGKSSAKTFSIAQLFLVLAYVQKVSAIAYRKEQTTIKTTIKESLKKAITSLYLSGAFTEMDFKIAGGRDNNIILKGLDEEGKVKGIEGFKYLLFDELDHFTQDEWMQANLSLRGIENQKLFATWNPISENSWVKQDIDKQQWIDLPLSVEDNPLSELHHTSFVKRSADGMTILIKTTYFDNKWIVGGNGYGYHDKNLIHEYENLLKLNPNSYRVNVLGEWGKAGVESPYCLNFNMDKHISDKAVFNPARQVVFSLDFNVEPFVCECAHIWTDSSGLHFYNFDEIVIEKRGSVPEMCDRILSIYGMRVVSNALFTGDAMQRKREIVQRDNIDAWTMIDTRFKLGKRLMVPRANPTVKENRHLINAIHAFHPDFKINPECKKLIYDCRFVEADSEGNIIKKNRQNEAQQSDALDCHRYMCNTFLRDFIENYRVK